MKVTDVSAKYFDTDNPAATGQPQAEGGGTTIPVAVLTTSDFLKFAVLKIGC
jgi:hypothetical protein